VSHYLPDVAQGNDGSRARAHAEYVSGTSGDMRIYIEWRSSGDSAYGAPVLARDNLGGELRCVDGGFGNLSHAHALHTPWTLAMIKSGETDMSEWYCTREKGTGAWTFSRV
jgi:hypothetical protein